MTVVNMHEAKTHLSRIVQKSLQGEEIIIAKGNTPLVKLVPIARVTQRRKLGGAKDLIVDMTEDFDAPLDDMEEYM